MHHNCSNLPPEAEHFNGRKRFDNTKKCWVAVDGEYWIQGQRFEVAGERVIPRKETAPKVDQQAVDLLNRLLARPDIFPDRVILLAMERSGTDTSVIKTRAEKAFLPAGRLFTDAERMGFSGMVDFFDPNVIASYAESL